MNLYKLTNTTWESGCYNEYDSCIVAAKTEAEAIQIRPEFRYTGDWCTPNQVQCTLIGHAMAGTVAGIILASFNAG